MTATPVRAGVIGVGAMGRNHARVYAEIESARLVAVADNDADALDAVAHRYGAVTYADYREMLDREKLDLVSVAVPTQLHRQVAEEVMRRSVHLLIEKPLAATVEDCRCIIDAARRANVRIGVGHVERFNPVVTELKRRIDAGEIGRVFQITIRRVGPFPPRVQDIGVLLDIGTHDIDMLFYLTGSEPVRISSESAQLLHSQHEDLAVGLMKFANGTIGVLIENWLSPTKVRDLVANGERGMFVADFLTQDLYFYENNYTESGWESLQVFRGMAEGNMTRYHIPRAEPLRLELEAFVDFVVHGSTFLATGEDGLRATQLAYHLAQQSRTGA